MEQVKELVISKPYPKQIEFFEAKCRYIAYGGARGGGKSWAMRTKLMLLAFYYPRNTDITIKKNSC